MMLTKTLRERAKREARDVVMRGLEYDLKDWSQFGMAIPGAQFNSAYNRERSRLLRVAIAAVRADRAELTGKGRRK